MPYAGQYAAPYAAPFGGADPKAEVEALRAQASQMAGALDGVKARIDELEKSET